MQTNLTTPETQLYFEDLTLNLDFNYQHYTFQLHISQNLEIFTQLDFITNTNLTTFNLNTLQLI
jgi:hypothetical protein